MERQGGRFRVDGPHDRKGGRAVRAGDTREAELKEGRRDEHETHPGNRVRLRVRAKRATRIQARGSRHAHDARAPERDEAAVNVGGTETKPDESKEIHEKDRRGQAGVWEEEGHAKK